MYNTKHYRSANVWFLKSFIVFHLRASNWWNIQMGGLGPISTNNIAGSLGKCIEWSNTAPIFGRVCKGCFEDQCFMECHCITKAHISQPHFGPVCGSWFCTISLVQLQCLLKLLVLYWLASCICEVCFVSQWKLRCYRCKGCVFFNNFFFFHARESTQHWMKVWFFLDTGVLFSWKISLFKYR